MAKRAAKAATPPKRARKTSAKAKPPATTQAAQTPAVIDWPADLPEGEKLAEDLFELIELGEDTVKSAAVKVGLKPTLVYQWKHRYPRFRERLELAVDVGIDMMTDDAIAIGDSARCRDTAAGAKERREARAEYRKLKRPQRFNVNPFKASDPKAGDDDVVFGVVIVPAKRIGGPAESARPVIEGTATPMATSAKPAPVAGKSFRITSDGY